MTENRTLGDFGGDSENDDSSAEDGDEASVSDSDLDVDVVEQTDPDDGASDAAEGGSGTADGSAETGDRTPRPATVTYSWSPDGDACAECGETVERRWRTGEGADDPDAMVCPDCKRW